MLQLPLDFLGSTLRRLKTPRAFRTKVDRTFEWKHGITIHLVNRPGARRYLLSLRVDGSARLVIPRRGTEAEAFRFLERSEAWLLKRVVHWRTQVPKIREPWRDQTWILFRGEQTLLRVVDADGQSTLSFADQTLAVAQPLPDYRDTVHAHLRRLAERELPVRTRELALVHSIVVNRVTVRAQKTRWGSCSARGTISLNWRLIQAPAFVVDYLIIHELMHRREMNHSARYWRHVEKACPDYRRAEVWLKKGGVELRA